MTRPEDSFVAIRCAMIDLPAHKMEELSCDKASLIALCENRARALFGTLTREVSMQIREELTFSQNVALLRLFNNIFSDIAPWKRTMRGPINGSIAAYLLGITEINPVAEEIALPNVFFAGPRFEKRILWKIGVSAQTEAELISRLRQKGIGVCFPVGVDEPVTSDTQHQLFFVRSSECETLECLHMRTGYDPADISASAPRWLHKFESEQFEEDLYEIIVEKTASPDTAYRIVRKLQCGKHMTEEQMIACEDAGIVEEIQRLQSGILKLRSKADALATSMQRSRLAYYVKH